MALCSLTLPLGATAQVNSGQLNHECIIITCGAQEMQFHKPMFYLEELSLHKSKRCILEYKG